MAHAPGHRSRGDVALAEVLDKLREEIADLDRRITADQTRIDGLTRLREKLQLELTEFQEDLVIIKRPRP